MKRATQVLMVLLTSVMFTVSLSSYGRDKTEEEKRREEEERRKKREERQRKQLEFHKVGDAGKHDKKAYEAEKDKAAKAAMAAALAAGDASKPKESVPIIPTAVGKERTYIGILSQEMLKLDLAKDAQKEKVVVLTTKAGQRVILSPESIAAYSLAGLDPRTLIGKEVTIITMASPRKIEDKPASYVHKIKQMARKDIGMMDDLE